MRFAPDEDQQAIFDHADRYAREQLYPLAQRMDDEEWWPEHVFREMGALGFLGTTVPERYGGSGMDHLSSGLVAQALARWNHAMALSWVAHDNLCVDNLYRNGSEHVRETYLPRLCSGEHIGALALTEPGAGSDALGSMRTTARRDGDRYVLNGSKLYITNGPVADIVLVYAKTSTSQGNKGISAFVVETATPGFQVAQKLVKMGFRGSQTAELVLDDCLVPAANMLGEEHEGHKVVMSGLDLERAMIAPISVGISERALDLALEWSRTREQFGKPIASFQMIQSKLADMYVLVEAARTLAHRVLAGIDEAPAGGGDRTSVQAAAAVMFAANASNQVLDDMLQIHGGSGYIWETEANRLFRAIKLLEIGAGTTEVRKLVIARGLLGRDIDR